MWTNTLATVPAILASGAGAEPAAEHSGMPTEIAVITLLVVASAVAMLVRRIKLPYTIALVVAGLAMGAARGLLPESVLSLHLSEDLLMAVLLPALLFEAAFHVNLTDFKANVRAILLLALPGVALGIALAGGAFAVVLPWFDLQVSLLIACLIGSMLAATDPVSVIALFKELGAPKRLALIMEGESLLNDGVAVVAFSALAAAAGYGPNAGQVDAAWVVRFLLLEIGGGLVIGLALGALVSWVLSLTEDHLVEITLTTVLAYGAYLLAFKVHASGVIAVVAAGMMCGNFGSKHGMSPATRLAVVSFWEYATFAVNSIVFLLIGMEIELSRLTAVLPAAAVVFLILTVVRAGVIWSVAPLAERWEGAFGRGWRPVLTWGGLRGGISMVLALWVVQAGIARGREIRDLVFATVLIILLLQGTTIGPLLRRLGLVFTSHEYQRAAALRARMKAVKAALKDLDRRVAEASISTSAYRELREQYAGRQGQIEEALEALAPSEEILDREIDTLRRNLALVEKDAIRSAFAKGTIGEQTMRDLLVRIDTDTEQPHSQPPHSDPRDSEPRP
ncbi:MAG TPA: cation:proton antiporter [Phycisphaerae bacterium]|nr:cation:proton antiporter [Phycisphaerae bacterium]